MKILMVTPMPPQAIAAGAIPILIHAELTGLLPRHSITLVTAAGPDPAELDALEHAREMGIDVQAVRRSEPRGRKRWERRWRLASTWLRGIYPWRTVWYAEPGMQQIIDRLVATRDFDVIQVGDNGVGLHRFPASIPKVLTEMEVRRPRPINWRGSRQGSPLRWALSEADWHRWPRYERMLWHRFDRIQVFTARDAQSLAMIAPDLADRVRVNPFSIDIPAPLDPALEQAGSILFVGNYTHPPNVDAALWLGSEIMPLLRQRYPAIRLTLVGSFPSAAMLAMAGDDIIITGRVPEIEPYLERAAVVLAPIRTGGGMRMKVLQGMAIGKAVVTTPRGAEGLTIQGQQPPLAVAEDAAGIADHILRLLNSEAERRSLGRRARQFALEHYSPDAYARRLEATYAEIIPATTP